MASAPLPLYPLTFAPLHRARPWGGALLARHFGGPTTPPAAESFALLDAGPLQSVVANGPLAGLTLHELLERAPAWLGRRAPPAAFPLRVKAFATDLPLALQVHPLARPGVAAAGQPPNSKVWYVVAAAAGARLQAELMPQYTQQQFLARLGKPELATVLYSFDAAAGDCYLLPAGRVHGLSAGNLILSIEQNTPGTLVLEASAASEDPDGVRSLEPEAVRPAINFKDRTVPRVRADGTPAERNRKLPLVRNFPSFSLEELRLVGELHERTSGGSALVLISVTATVTVTGGGVSVAVPPGQACLLPAPLGEFSLVPARRGTLLLASLRA